MVYVLYIYPWTNIPDYFIPYCETHTEWVVVVGIPIVVVEVEYSCIGTTIVPVTTTFEERIVRIHKVSVIIKQVYPQIFLFARTKVLTKRSYFLPYLFFLFLNQLKYSPDNRFHITLLRDTYGMSGRRRHSHCCRRSRIPPHWYYYRSRYHHDWRTDSPNSQSKH